MTQVVVVGAGLAGAGTVTQLREQGYDGRLVLLGSEPELPYERPPLSKGYLLGSDERASVFVHDAGWYAEHDVDLRTSTTVATLDLGARDVVDAAGGRTRFDTLVLATGSEPRRLGVPGEDLAGVHVLRTLDDSDRLRAALVPGRRVVVVGGGWIGLEVAAAARAAGCPVDLVVRGALPLRAVLGARVATVFADLHREHGVALHAHRQVRAVRPDGAGTGVGSVELDDGTLLAADVLVVGVGARPRTDLAERAGLAVHDGVLVDASLRSSHPGVLAVGDIASATHAFLGERVRVEHWATALHQPEVAAATVLGQAARYDRLPYFFTDQYDLGMEYVGHVGAAGFDEVVVRGELAAREAIVFWLRGGRVLAGMNANVWDVVEQVEAVIRSRAVVDVARLADPDVPLDDLAR